jgi:hypothetical protein
MGTWPGRGPNRVDRFPRQKLSTAYAVAVGYSLNLSVVDDTVPSKIPPVEKIYMLTLPTVDSTIVNYGFSISLADGSFSFAFKWLGSVWNCWVTMPDGTIRPAGCYPQVPNWTAYKDWGLVLLSNKTILGQADLNGAVMFLLKWKT